MLGNRAFIGRGLVARFLTVLPPSMVGRRCYEPEPIPPLVQQAYNQLCQDLLSAASAEPDPDAPWQEEKILYLSPSAYELSKQYSYQLEQRLLEEEDNDLGFAMGKLHGEVLRIAAILHLAQAFSGGGYTNQIGKQPCKTLLN